MVTDLLAFHLQCIRHLHNLQQFLRKSSEIKQDEDQDSRSVGEDDQDEPTQRLVQKAILGAAVRLGGSFYTFCFQGVARRFLSDPISQVDIRRHEG